MAQGTRSSRPKTSCCRCRRRVDGNSRLTNVGLLCDSCYELLQRSELGRRLYRLVYQLSGPGGVTPVRPVPAPAGVDLGEVADTTERVTGPARKKRPVQVLAA
jgi:hypothetical protein